jgi:transcriptional regulator with XRE-family HTH domain
MEETEFGVYLKSLRGKRSIREIGRLTGLSHNYLSILERGHDPQTNNPTNPTIYAFRKLADAHNISIIDLMIKSGHLAESEVAEWKQ